MIQATSIQFLQDLRTNNHKEWFDANRKRYESARKNFIAFNEALIQGIEHFDEGVAVSQLDPRKTLMRINRDIRFSKDKTPYNSHLFTSINMGGKKHPGAGYFFSLSPGNSFFGAGVYKPPTDILNQIRQEIDYNAEAWLELVQDQEILKHFESIKSSDALKRPPKGYDKTHPLLDWIKKKDYYLQQFLTDDELLAEDLVETLLEKFRVAAPFVQFLNQVHSG